MRRPDRHKAPQSARAIALTPSAHPAGDGRWRTRLARHLPLLALDRQQSALEPTHAARFVHGGAGPYARYKGMFGSPQKVRDTAKAVYSQCGFAAEPSTCDDNDTKAAADSKGVVLNCAAGKLMGLCDDTVAAVLKAPPGWFPATCCRSVQINVRAAPA